MIGRFQVMAVLQYLRFKKLGLEDEQAKSLALCKAIFYARAKYGFYPKAKSKEELLTNPKTKVRETYKILGKFKIHPDNIGIEIIGGDRGYYAILPNGKKLYFIGQELQTEEKWNASIRRRFLINFSNDSFYKKCIEEARKYLNDFDISILKNSTHFFNRVYKPVRDEFSKKWSIERQNLENNLIKKEV